MGGIPKMQGYIQQSPCFGPYIENAPTLRLYLTPMTIGIPN